MPLRLHAQGVSIQVRVSPGAKKSACTGIVDVADGKKALKVSVQAPPEDGRANKAVIELLSTELGKNKRDFSLISGEQYREKVILISGDSSTLMAEVSAWIAAVAPTSDKT